MKKIIKILLIGLLFFIIFGINNAISEDNIIHTNFSLVNITEPYENNYIIKTTMIRSSNTLDESLEQITSSYIKEKVGDLYFKDHFSFQSIDNRVFISYTKYDFVYDDNNIGMMVAYDTKNKKVIPSMSSFLTRPIKIRFNKEDVDIAANNLNLPKPRKITLVYSSDEDTLAWKVLWDHEPTNEEKANNTIEGYLFNSLDGNTIKIYHYSYEPTNKILDESIGKELIIKKVWYFILSIFGRY